MKVLYSKEKPIDISGWETGEDPGARRSVPGSISFVPPVAGLLIAGQVIREPVRSRVRKGRGKYGSVSDYMRERHIRRKESPLASRMRPTTLDEVVATAAYYRKR